MKHKASTDPAFERFVANACLVVLGGLVALAPTVTAQFGTQLGAGDYGHVPVTKAAAVPVKVQWADFGLLNSAQDDCAYLDTTSVTAGSPPTINPNHGLTNKDLRLTTCGIHKQGTELGDADVMEKQAARYVASNAKYADVNSNGKYDRGDYAYLTTAPAADSNLAVSINSTTWTIRLRSTPDQGAGTLVMSGDKDLSTYQSFVKGLTLSLVEREDKIWFLVPHAANTAPYDAKGALILENSIRVNTASAPQPAFKVMKLDLPTLDVPAGDAFTAKAEVQNTGKVAGVGVVTSKVNGFIVDAQATPILSPGEKTVLTMRGFAPRFGTAAAFEVGDQFARIQIVGGQDTGSVDVNELAVRLALLEAEMASMRTSIEGPVDGVEVQQAGQEASRTPAPGPLVVAFAVGSALVLRRRSK